MFNFNEISSIDSTFDTLKKFHKGFKKVEAVKSQTKEIKQKKLNVLKHESMLYDELISAYKIEYNQTFKRKDKEFERHRLLTSSITTRSITITSVTTKSISATKMVKVTKIDLMRYKM